MRSVKTNLVRLLRSVKPVRSHQDELFSVSHGEGFPFLVTVAMVNRLKNCKKKRRRKGSFLLERGEKYVSIVLQSLLLHFQKLEHSFPSLHVRLNSFFISNIEYIQVPDDLFPCRKQVDVLCLAQGYLSRTTQHFYSRLVT